jgi:hypothetical protein
MLEILGGALIAAGLAQWTIRGRFIKRWKALHPSQGEDRGRAISNIFSVAFIILGCVLALAGLRILY